MGRGRTFNNWVIHKMVQDDSTTTDVALSVTTNMDCRLVNALDGKDVCTERP